MDAKVMEEKMVLRFEVDGLAALVRLKYNLDPLFTSKYNTMVILLYWFMAFAPSLLIVHIAHISIHKISNYRKFVIIY